MARKRTIIIASAAGIALLGAAGAVAAHGKYGRGGPHGFHRGGMEQLIERLDTDKDGTITKAEATARRDKSLATYDADGSKTLSIKEFEGLWAEITRHRMVRAFQRLDRDGDGQVTVEELDRPLNRMFTRLDRDGDGKVTAEEMKPRRWHGEHRGHRDGDDDRGPGMRGNR
jgi:Ca2+-binding EF-hand superfamily protein